MPRDAMLLDTRACRDTYDMVTLRRYACYAMITPYRALPCRYLRRLLTPLLFRAMIIIHIDAALCASAWRECRASAAYDASRCYDAAILRRYYELLFLPMLRLWR